MAYGLALKTGMPYLYAWNRMKRKGEICTLLTIARRMDSVLVQFADGYRAITSAKALRAVPAGYQPQPKLLF